jgi:glutaredoxin
MLLLLIGGAVSAGGVYKWVDEHGKVHFGDRPPLRNKAEEISIRIRSYANVVEVVAETGSNDNTVRMLSTTWCGVCKRAKAWLAQKGIRYAEYDVETSPTGKSEYQRLQGRGVPIILVGSQRMNGFDPERLQQVLRTAGYSL